MRFLYHPVFLFGVLFFMTLSSLTESKTFIYFSSSELNSIFLIPFGGMSMSTSSQGTAGQADLHFIVKGSKKYIDLNLLMDKELNTDWQIEVAGR